MKDNSIIPEALRTAYIRFSAVQNEEESKAFWEEMARDELKFAPGILDQHLKEGLNALSDRVDELLKKVKQPV